MANKQVNKFLNAIDPPNRREPLSELEFKVVSKFAPGLKELIHDDPDLLYGDKPTFSKGFFGVFCKLIPNLAEDKKHNLFEKVPYSTLEMLNNEKVFSTSDLYDKYEKLKEFNIGQDAFGEGVLMAYALAEYTMRTESNVMEVITLQQQPGGDFFTEKAMQQNKNDTTEQIDAAFNDALLEKESSLPQNRDESVSANGIPQRDLLPRPSPSGSSNHKPSPADRFNQIQAKHMPKKADKMSVEDLMSHMGGSFEKTINVQIDRDMPDMPAIMWSVERGTTLTEIMKFLEDTIGGIKEGNFFMGVDEDANPTLTIFVT